MKNRDSSNFNQCLSFLNVCCPSTFLQCVSLSVCVFVCMCGVCVCCVCVVCMWCVCVCVWCMHVWCVCVYVCVYPAGPKILSLNDAHRGFPIGLQVMSSPQACLLHIDDTFEKCKLHDGLGIDVESIEVRGGGAHYM